MRYTVEGREIRSENAAKPYTQKSLIVESYLKSIKGNPSLLDFGCGKLRYSDVLVEISKRITFLDSSIQLNRKQVIRDERTTVRSYVTTHYPTGQTLSYEDINMHDELYDVITCTNVLSAIPCESTLIEVLNHIRNLLNKDGYVVFVNQHKNSYFKKYESGEKWLYGYLNGCDKKSSYYGIFNKYSIEELLKTNGFEVKKIWCVRESTFAEAKKAERS